MYRDLSCGSFDGSEFPGMHISPRRRTVRYEIEYYLTDADVTFCDEESYTIRADHIQIARPGQVRYSHLPFNTMFLKFSAEGRMAALLDAAPPYFKATQTKRLRALFESFLCRKNRRANCCCAPR